jgi:Mg-chelatase subunit ChlI
VPVRSAFVAELVERAAFLARGDKRIDRRSGVSQRMPITVLETAVSNAERRALSAGEPRIVPRIADVYAALPAITGKMELEYEGELQGAEAIARDLIAAAAREIFDRIWDAGAGRGGGVLRPRRRASDLRRRLGLAGGAPRSRVKNPPSAYEALPELPCSGRVPARRRSGGVHAACPVRRPTRRRIGLSCSATAQH